METVQVKNGDYLISTDPQLLDVDMIHQFLANDSYWARGIPKATVQRSIANALCFGVYHQGTQVGFARIVTDYSAIAYLGDVFILPAHRGKGLSKWLMQTIMAHPALQNLRRWLLATADAHGLYRQFGFKPLQEPERFMQVHFPDIYRQQAT